MSDEVDKQTDRVEGDLEVVDDLVTEVEVRNHGDHSRDPHSNGKGDQEVVVA